MRIIGRRYDTGEVVEITYDQNRVASCEPSTETTAPWIAPAFVDLQVNGYARVEFNDPALTADQIAAVCASMDDMGVAQFLPTITTDSQERITKSLGVIAAACRENPNIATRIPGIHIEGPYISQEDGPRGAHPLQHCRPPSTTELSNWVEAAGQLPIHIVTLSPEYEEAAEYIKVASQKSIIAIGHTAASSAQIEAAASAGASMSTHLGNGAHGQIRRHPNYLWDQLADDRIIASLIADGHHLPPAVLKTFYRAKGPERCVLVSDITSMAGLPPGRYATSGLGEVEVLEDGRLVVAGQRQYLAGAAAPIGDGVANMVRFTDASFAQAIEMASVLPAKLIGVEPGGFEVGALTSWVLFDWSPGDARLEIRQTIVASASPDDS